MTQLIKRYLDYLRYEKNYSSHTEISYFVDLSQFIEFLQKNDLPTDVNLVDTDIVRSWVISLMKSKYSPRSVNRKLSALKSFYKYLLRMGVVRVNPVKKIVGPKMAKPIPSFVNYSDMEKVLDETNFTATFESIRNHCILELFYMTGMRRSELIGLCDSDVDVDTGLVKVLGKRNKQRLIPIGGVMVELLKEYLEARNAEVQNSEGSFFVKEDGSPLYAMLVYRLVVSNLKYIPTLSKASPHVLRHSFATGMLDGGADIKAVKELLGHASLAATEVYTHTSLEELKKIYNKAHPRA